MGIRIVVSCLLASLLAACSSGDNRTSNDPFVPAARAAKHAQFKLVVRIPRRSHKGKRPRYISPATQGMSFSFASGSKTLAFAAGVTPSSHGCTGYPSATTCTIVLPVPPGTYELGVNAYDTAPVDGVIPHAAKLLSTASNVPLIVVAGTNTTKSLTLDGVPASIAISNVPSATPGTPFPTPQPFTVTVEDASGATIVGTYETPVTLADSNPVRLPIITSGPDNPSSGALLSSSDSAALQYYGASIVAQITATAGAATTIVGFVPSGVTGVWLDTDSSLGANPGLCPAGTPGDLRYAMCNAAAGSTIVFGCGNPCTIDLGAMLPPIARNLTIDGTAFGNVVIDGGSLYRAFFVESGTVTIENLQIQHARAIGGNGGKAVYGAGGGGGAGLGGAVFIDGASVTIANDYFLDDTAVGGKGGGDSNTAGDYSSGGGGGGMGADGGSPPVFGYAGGGSVTQAGAGGGYPIDSGGIAFDLTVSMGNNPMPNPAHYGGGGGGSVGSYFAAAGGFGGGGGAGSGSGENGGLGGFGGGGGGGGYNGYTSNGAGGNGGAGGGGGGGNLGIPSANPPGGALATISGGNADGNDGGGGAAAGPVIFVNTGTLTTTGSGQFGASSTAGGAGGGTATAGGADQTPVYNNAGTVNGSTHVGDVSSALSGSQPSLRKRPAIRKAGVRR